MKGWLECVPNFSEGRNPEVLARLRQAITAVQGTLLLDETADADHNRSVFTFVGPPEPVGESLLRAAAVAVETIDLRSHQGCHPRIGALDVAPFVPLDEGGREAAVTLARRIGEELWQRLQVPVYFYGDAAMSQARRLLEDVRRGQFEGLSERLPADVIRRPDIGGDVLHPTAGATAIGVRRFLIAFNVDLETTIRSAPTGKGSDLPCVGAQRAAPNVRPRRKLAAQCKGHRTPSPIWKAVVRCCFGRSTLRPYTNSLMVNEFPRQF
jgi:glutamate formiminotransferase / 5-formyltetrahydrofolate cyclo-ligase